MYSTIYVERNVRSHSRVEEIVSRFPQATVIDCNNYTEVFNPKAQSFRLQKQNPSLLLAEKRFNHVLPTPPSYGVGGDVNYYFSPMLNCIYDCRYCFLQGMYRSAHHVVFVNYEDYLAAIQNTVNGHGDKDETWFFSGYNCDSLALEPVVGAAAYFVDALSELPGAWLELRTKSTQIRSLTKRNPTHRTVVAFSFTPDEVSRQLEHKVPEVGRRIDAMANLQQQGWKIGLRFDPLIYSVDYRIQYSRLFDDVFSKVDADQVHSVSYGSFRLPRDFFKTMEKIYPDDEFLALPFESRERMVSFPKKMDDEMTNWCHNELRQYVDGERLFHATQEAGLND